MSDTKIQYILRAHEFGAMYDDFEFLSKSSARKWLADPFFTDAKYAVEVRTVRFSKRCTCCGRRRVLTTTTRTMTPSAFLAMD